MKKTFITIIATTIVLLIAQNMGINVDQPTEALDIDGNIKLTGAVKFADGSQQESAPASMPAGVMLQYAAETPPNGWLLCDGSEVSREDYSQLFALISTTYGEGDGSTTFNLPDLRGRMVIGLDNMGGNSADRVVNEQADVLGGSAGEEMHELTVDEMPSHGHSISTMINHSGNTNGILRSNAEVQQNGSYNTNNAGNSQPHNNMPPYLTVNYIIKY